MNKIAIATKLQSLQAQITLLSMAVAERPDFDIDEKNWAKIKPALKKARAQVFKQTYEKSQKN